MTDIVDDFLVHHGVLGMHWGHHKSHLKEPGRFTSEKSISSRSGRSTKTATVTKQSKTDAEVPSDAKHLTPKQKKVLVAAGIGVGVGIIAAGAILAKPSIVSKIADNKATKALLSDLNSPELKGTMASGKEFMRKKIEEDTHIPSGTHFHRITHELETSMNGPKYATYLNEDVAKFRRDFIPFAHLGPGNDSGNKKVFKTVFTTKATSKIAGTNTIHKTAMDLIKDPTHHEQMKKEILDYYKDTPAHLHPKLDNISSAELVKKWTGVSMQGGSDFKSPLTKALFNDLKSKNYSGVSDYVNTGSGGSKHAVLLINEAMVNTVGSELTDSDRAAAGRMLAKLAKKK